MSFVIISCDQINERTLPNSTGKAGDLLIIIDSTYYNHKTGAAIKNVFTQEVPGLPQREPYFDLIQVPHRSFDRIFRTLGNIMIINIDPENKNKLTITKNVWSKLQLVINITAKTDKSASETIAKNANTLLSYFNQQELERLSSKYKVNFRSKNAKLLRKKFNLTLNLDDLYIVAQESDDFIWLRKEKSVGGHPVSQGILVYTYPYLSDSIFEVNNLVDKRNYYTKKYVSGSVSNSYMVSYLEYTPIQKEVNLNGIYTNELRGLWQMQGDFMGGPFINYSMVDESRNRVICIDGFVYAPKFDKREFLREQEALIRTITF